MIRQDESQYYNALIQYVWNIYNLIFIIKIITMASLTTRSGKYSAVLVHKSINYSTDESVIENVSFVAFRINVDWTEIFESFGVSN